MKVTVKHITIKIVALLMIGLMGMLIVNSAIFLHVHKLDDGTIISHSHPYDKTNDSHPYKTHHHTKAELLFFHNLDILFPLVFLVLVLIAFTKKFPILSDLTITRQLVYLDFHKGRAPPVS